VFGPHPGELLVVTGGDPGVLKELPQIQLVGFSGVRGGGAKQPGNDGPADGFTEVAGHAVDILAGAATPRVRPTVR
jgi:hypothetical protein